MKTKARFLLVTLLAALLLLTALPFWRAVRAEATPPPLRRILEISFNSRPSELVTAGDVTLSFSIFNSSSYDAQNVYLTSSDGLHSESLGQIAAGDTQTFNRVYTVSEAELNAGEISFIVSHDSPGSGGEPVNYTVSTPIERSIAAPKAEFTCQLSSELVPEGGTVTITYRVRNTGNVPLSQLRVSDALGDFVGRVEALDIGESRVFTSRVTVNAATSTAPALSYSVPAEDGRDYETTLAPREIGIAAPELAASFAADCDSVEDGGTVLVTLMLRNLGNVGYRQITVTDAAHGGVVAASLRLPAGGEPLLVSRVYPVRGTAEYQFHVEAVSQTGERTALDTERISVPVRAVSAAAGLDVQAAARTPRIRRGGDVAFDISLSATAAAGVRDVRLSEQERGPLRNFEIIPAGDATQVEATYAVGESEDFVFIAEWTDNDGTHIVRSLPVSVTIAADGVVPEGEEASKGSLFSAARVRVGESPIFLYLILFGIVVLVALILALVVTSRKERRASREREAQQRQRRREELEKTNRFVPVKSAQTKRERRQRRREESRSDDSEAAGK